MLSCASVIAMAGCGEAMADVVALWVDSVSADDGDRPVRLYDAGERDVLSIVPDIVNTGTDPLQVGVDDRGRGIVLSATEETVWVERASGRRVVVTPRSVGRRERMAAEFSFTRNGDGVLRALDVGAEVRPTWLLAPTSGPQGLRVHVLSPPDVAAPSRRWTLHHAADAPVMVLAEVEDDADESSVSGQVVALAYPSALGQGPVVDDLRPLARGALTAAHDTEGGTLPAPPFEFLPGCRDHVCVSPSGRMVYTRAAGGGCDVWRWSWVEATSSDVDTPPERVSLACPDARETRLVAVLDDDLLVLDDALRVYLVDLDAGSVVGLPKPGGLLVPYLVDRGHGLVLSSQQGEVARIDAAGPRLVSGVQSACVLRDGFAVSPRGVWVVQSCNGQTGAASGIDGLIQRISVLGSELYTGLPMRPIAIDDEGNALLYSVGSDDQDGVPRGLFVLSGDGQLTRVDGLEPAPAEVLLTRPDGEARTGRFAAAGPS